MIRLLILIFFCQLAAFERPFCIVIPSYNNKDWFEQNLDTIFEQKYHNYRVIYVADAPTDGTETLVAKYVKERNQEHRFTLLINRERQGILACMCQAIFSCDKEEIIVDLDGNDWLAHDEVLAELNKIYADPDVWMTYGQFLRYPGLLEGFASKVPTEIIEENRFRSFGGAVTHLKTFYAGLFQEIEKKDFLFEGKFIQKAADLAYTIPILEMAGHHTRFIPNVLYIYNHSYPLHDHKVSNALEEKMDRFIRGKEPYFPLDSLPTKKLLPIYAQIEDLCHPTLHDYSFIQDFLSYGHREKIELLADMEPRMRNLKIIGDHPAEFPRSGKIAVNCSSDEKGDCLLLYSTFNDRYPKGLERLVKLIENSDFKGHILYRLGGWPNVEEGSLALSHVPYAFKVSFFKEAERLGYKRALWLDTAVVPLVSLNSIFEMMADQGAFVMSNGRMIGTHANEEALVFFGINSTTAYQIPSCSAGLFGVDFTNPVGRKIIDWWHRAAYDKDAFFSARSDQNALSVVLYQLGITNFIGLDRMPHSPHDIRSDSLFWLDREFVH